MSHFFDVIIAARSQNHGRLEAVLLAMAESESLRGFFQDTCLAILIGCAAVGAYAFAKETIGYLLH